MNSYVVLLRGINVGGKNKIPMTELKICLQEMGCTDVVTYIQSGNAIVRSDLDAPSLGDKIEMALSDAFELDSDLVKVLVLTHDQLQTVVENKPEGFGERPDEYYSDVIFLMGIDVADAMAVFDPREGVDKVWPGDGVVYSQRLGALRTKSRLNKIMASPLYKSMTVRNWNTTTKLLEMMGKTHV